MLASGPEISRYASMLGSKAVSRKIEGNVYNPERNSLCLPMSEVSKCMVAGMTCPLPRNLVEPYLGSYCMPVYETRNETCRGGQARKQCRRQWICQDWL